MGRIQEGDKIVILRHLEEELEDWNIKITDEGDIHD